MARAIDWAIDRPSGQSGSHLVLNVGTSSGNYQVQELAEAVADATPGALVSLASNGRADPRSYRVDFDLFKSLAPEAQPRVGLEEAIYDLIKGLAATDFEDPDFHSSRFARLVALEELRRGGFLTNDLRWVAPKPSPVAA